eukprot:TRINITY_DN54214_c0_g1_i1.p1 TRINITY_DN54214_c0_g1~~TRINITY_DN54214_c0_g1_i1.p1  ORF type:complete len:130 (+),score=26.57 TRINITY_DN54214_c0_g1_i1:92-481(+)
MPALRRVLFVVLCFPGLHLAMDSDRDPDLDPDLSDDLEPSVDCKHQVENRFFALKNRKGQTMSELLKYHDVDSDDHVSVDEIKRMFMEANVDSECLHFAQQTMEHLLNMHDHDGDGLLTHHELTIHREL